MALFDCEWESRKRVEKLLLLLCGEGPREDSVTRQAHVEPAAPPHRHDPSNDVGPTLAAVTDVNQQSDNLCVCLLIFMGRGEGLHSPIAGTHSV